MKRVFTNSEDVIHLFAQKQQTDARSSNTFFEKSSWRDKDGSFASTVEYGTKLYSYGYHYLLAEFINANTIYINDDGFSVTTAKHVREVSWATRQYKQFFKSKCDLERVYRSCVDNAAKLANARKPELYISEIVSLFDSLNEYLRFTRTITKVKKDKRYSYIARLVRDINDDSDALKAKLNKARKDAADKRRRKEAKEIKVALQKFNDYEVDSFRVGDYDYLRISKDGTHVETSQRVKVTVEEATLLYRMILAKRDIRGHRIGSYRVTSINGTLKIGCHNINMDSVHKVGKQLI